LPRTLRQATGFRECLDRIHSDHLPFLPYSDLSPVLHSKTQLIIGITKDVNKIIRFLPIRVSEHLSHIPTMPITEHQKVEGLSMDVDRVQQQGQK
jgi:hypothetical protein